MGKKSSKTSNKPWSAAQPYLLGGANTLQGAYNAVAPGIQSATDQVTSLIPSMIDKYKAGDSGVNSAKNYIGKVLAGRYLNNNPYLDDMVDITNNNVMNDTQAALGLRGLTGGSTYADLISKNLAENETGLRYSDYGAERDRMTAAAQTAPALAAADAIQIAPLLQTLSASTLPLEAASQYAGGISSLFNGTGTQTSKPSTASSIAQGVGTVASIASLFSDERLKEDIRKVGKTDDGLPIYTYKYRGDDTTHMGVMAQEVEKKQPKASGPRVGGYRTVNYAEVR